MAISKYEGEPIELVLADVDGTLVTSEKELTPRAIEAVRKLKEAGIRFAVTSGRPPRGGARPQDERGRHPFGVHEGASPGGYEDARRATGARAPDRRLQRRTL